MHVAVDVRTIQAGFAGDRIYLENLIRHLPELSGISQVSLYGDTKLKGEVGGLAGSKVDIELFGAPRGWLWTPWAVPRHLRQGHVDVFHAPYLVPTVSPVPSVVTIHDMAFMLLPEHYPRQKARLRNFLIGLSAHRAAAVITESESSRQDLQRLFHLRPEKIHIIPLAAAEHFTPGDRGQAETLVQQRFVVKGPYILTVGFSSPRKNVLRLLEAVGSMSDDLPVTVVVVGVPGEEDPEAIKSRFPKLDQRLIFTGWITEQELVALYRAAQVFAFPSLYEGFGLPVVEAMSCGTPVITSTASSLPEVAGDAALLVDPNDTQNIATALRRVLQDKPLAQELTQRGFERARLFSWQRTAELTYEVYRHVTRC